MLLKKELEAARDSLLEQLLVFSVPGSINPYRAALLEAGVPEGIIPPKHKKC